MVEITRVQREMPDGSKQRPEAADDSDRLS